MAIFSIGLEMAIFYYFIKQLNQIFGLRVNICHRKFQFHTCNFQWIIQAICLRSKHPKSFFIFPKNFCCKRTGID